MRRALGYVLAFMAGGILFNALHGFTGEVSAESGQCRFSLAENGTFYQYNQRSAGHTEGTSNYMTPRCVEIAYAAPFGASAFGWKVGVIVAGAIHARDNVATMFDADAFATGLVCDFATGRGCVGKMNGSGNTWGIAASLTHTWRLPADLRLVGEGGLFFFHHHFHNHPVQLDCTGATPRCGQHPDYDESSSLTAMPATFAGAQLMLDALRPSLGATPYLSLERFWSMGHRALSLTDHSFTKLAAGLAWRW